MTRIAARRRIARTVRWLSQLLVTLAALSIPLIGATTAAAAAYKYDVPATITSTATTSPTNVVARTAARESTPAPSLGAAGAAFRRVSATEDGGDAFDLFHGTDTESASNIIANGIDRGAASELGGGDEFWTTTNQSDAELFAKVNPAGGQPAVVGIKVAGGIEKAVTSGILKPAEGPPGAYTVENWGAFNRIATYEPAG